MMPTAKLRWVRTVAGRISSMSLPRIVVIGLGGTIGMVRGADGALRPAASVGELLAQVLGDSLI